MSVCLSCGMVPVACVYENDDSEEAYGCLLRYGALRTALTASQQRVKELDEMADWMQYWDVKMHFKDWQQDWLARYEATGPKERT